MGRRRMEMKLIENEKARNKVFEKRRNNLLKKAKELSILCDSKVLLIIYELDKQKPEIWPRNDEEAEQFISKFKQQTVKDFSQKACDSIASNMHRSGEKFAISDHKGMINHLSENELQKLCCDLDAKIGAVMNAIESKQVVIEGHRSPKMLGGSQGIGFFNKKKEKEVVMYQEPGYTQQDQSFEMLSNNPNFMESPRMMMMMMQNGVSYPEFGGSSSVSNIPYVPLPIQTVDPSWPQPAYMNANSSMGYYDPTIHHIPPGVSYTMTPEFRTQMNP